MSKAGVHLVQICNRGPCSSVKAEALPQHLLQPGGQAGRHSRRALLQHSGQHLHLREVCVGQLPSGQVEKGGPIAPHIGVRAANSKVGICLLGSPACPDTLQSSAYPLT